MTDAELLEASRRGEQAAFGELVERYHRVVAAVSYSRTRDQALSEDVAQETFIAAWRQLDQLREPNRLKAWLCGIARNLARKAKRHSEREVIFEADEPLARENPFDDVCEAQAERVVGEALARVPETYRDVLVLYYREQQSVREVAETLGISEAAALQRLSRGRQYLATGVTSLVEKSLRGHRVRKNLVAAVIAALPPLVPSRVDAATPSSHGGSMIKLAIAATALTAAGTTAYLVHDARTAPTPAAQIASQATATPSADRPLVPTAPPAMPAVKADDPAAPTVAPSHRIAPPDTTPTIDRATMQRLKLDQGPSRGPTTAPVTIVMFTDLQCPYCGNVHGTLDQLFDEYPNKLRLVIKQMPVHKTAVLAAEAALAADAQGKFWELDRLMIANPDDLSRDAILELAKQTSLDVNKLRDALDRHTYADAVKADMATANELEINGTPSFVINGRKVVGALPIEEIRATVDASLQD